MSIIQIIIYFNFMKKLIYLTILVLIVACGGNDSDDSNTSIVGNWQLTAMLESGTPIHNSCDLESNMTLSITNTGKYNQYFSDDPATEPCGLDGILDMTWSEGSSSTYYISFVGIGDNGEDISFSAVLGGETLTIDGDDDEVIVFTRN
ncbi:MAG: hypothetical protein ACI93N_001832 [Flavobacteriaceae bacterium]|jgi:hypothetical protein|tara:strand:- start:160 stop:603 length:444 start_codon:yes stop_codon:yes gene_type:complete